MAPSREPVPGSVADASFYHSRAESRKIPARLPQDQSRSHNGLPDSGDRKSPCAARYSSDCLYRNFYRASIACRKTSCSPRSRYGTVHDSSKKKAFPPPAIRAGLIMAATSAVDMLSPSRNPGRRRLTGMFFRKPLQKKPILIFLYSSDSMKFEVCCLLFLVITDPH